MNTRNIQSKSIWTSSGEKSATILALANFHDYHFDDGGGKVDYRLIGMEDKGTQVTEDGIVYLGEVAIDYFSGSVDIPSSIIQQWGASDDIIWTYVANTLNIQFA